MNAIASTPPQKRALAAALAEHDPEFLADLKSLSARFGPFESVEYQSELHGDAVAAAFGKRTEEDKHD